MMMIANCTHRRLYRDSEENARSLLREISGRPTPQAHELVQGARGEAGEVKRHEGEATPPAEGDDPVSHALLEDPRHALGLHLQTRDGAVVAHPQLPKTELPQAILELIHLAQPFRRDLGPIGEARRQTGQLRLVPGGQTEGP